MDARLMAIVAEGKRGRIYLSPRDSQQEIARSANRAGGRRVWTTPSHDVDRLPMYGMRRWRDAVTPRQLVALTTFSDLVLEARAKALEDATAAGMDARSDARSPTAAPAPKPTPMRSQCTWPVPSTRWQI